MPHPLIEQLRFTRGELVRLLDGIDPVDAERRLLPNNSLAGIVGQLANHEHFFFGVCAQGRRVVEGLHLRVGSGQPASTPPLDEMWQAWTEITAAADTYLSTVTTQTLQTYFEWKGKPREESVGTMLLRNIYHYWYFRHVSVNLNFFSGSVKHG